jgi:hypothetical protein
MKKYTKDEFINYLRGVLDAHGKSMSVDSDDIIDLIKDALDSVEDNPVEAPKPNQYLNGFSTTPGTNLVYYHEICRTCNPKFGGSGVCGCTMANDIVNNPNNGITITNTSTSTENIDNNKTYLNSMQYSTSQQSAYLYTEDEVSKLLESQRGNSYVAVLHKTGDAKIAIEASKAPEPGQWRKKVKK